jgi:hypothetical protein
MAVMPLPTNTIASSANVFLKAGGARLLWSSSKCTQFQTHPRPLTFHSLPLFSTDNNRRRRRSVRWLPSFCTEAVTPVSLTAGADDNVEDDGEKKTRMIKEAADTLDIRVGRVLRAWRHEEADSLYVEEVDVGEPEPRIICSGLVNYIPLHQLQVFLYLFNSIPSLFTLECNSKNINFANNWIRPCLIQKTRFRIRLKNEKYEMRAEMNHCNLFQQYNGTNLITMLQEKVTISIQTDNTMEVFNQE